MDRHTFRKALRVVNFAAAWTLVLLLEPACGGGGSTPDRGAVSAPTDLVYSGNPAVYTKGTAITANTPGHGGGAVDTYSVSPDLPAGLSLGTATGIITGTPSAVAAAASYTVTASNAAGSTSAILVITVNDEVPCTPGARRCSDAVVETCSSAGTAWLYSMTCRDACVGGSCTGPCTPASRRCNGLALEQCDGTGTSWNVVTTCSTRCDGSALSCALAQLDVATSTSLDGEVVVDGPVTVRSGAVLTSPAGDLTLRATSITVEAGGVIVASPTGTDPRGRGGNATSATSCGGGGGGYGSGGYVGGCPLSGYGGRAGATWGASTDASVAPGAAGGNGGSSAGAAGAGGYGGGVLRLIAPSVNVAGLVRAEGGNGAAASSNGGGGSGGGVLVAADQVTVSGTLSAAGGSGGTPQSASYHGGNGGNGRIKVLHGSTQSITGSITPSPTSALLPPLTITSSTHPDPSLIYNDGFTSVRFAWERPFPSLLGYYWLVSGTEAQVPTPATGQFVAGDAVSLTPAALSGATSWFHVAVVDGNSAVGTVESRFGVRVNSTPPNVTSTSHPSSTTWYQNASPYFTWTFPVADADLKGAHWVVDHYGTTVPTTTDSFVPVSSKQLLVPGLDGGVWALHVVSVDTRGYRTRQAAHQIVRIGSDPGSGSIQGRVVDGSSAAVSGATVTINRGLFGDRTTNGAGDYAFAGVPAGAWELTASAPGLQPLTRTVTVGAGGTIMEDFTLAP